MVAYMATHKATWRGGLDNPRTSRLAPIQAVVAGSVLHAVGQATRGACAEEEQIRTGLQVPAWLRFPFPSPTSAKV